MIHSASKCNFNIAVTIDVNISFTLGIMSHRVLFSITLGRRRRRLNTNEKHAIFCAFVVQLKATI